jgi:ribulose-phosphate 3-epimerase
VVAALKKITDVPLDVHLMIDNADDTVGWYLDAGADMVTVHAEGTWHLHRVVQRIRAAGASPAVSLNPATPVSTLHDILGDVDMVLLMSVNPGFGAQTFIPRVIDKTREVIEACESLGVAVPTIQIDGGITPRPSLRAWKPVRAASSPAAPSPARQTRLPQSHRFAQPASPRCADLRRLLICAILSVLSSGRGEIPHRR